MSYHKIYDSLLVKLIDEQKQHHYLPLTLSGPSNCYESDNSRVREWQGFVLSHDKNGKRGRYQPIWTCSAEAVKDMVDDAEQYYGRTYGRSERAEVTFVDFYKRYGWYTGIAVRGGSYDTDFNKLLNLFSRRKFKEAVTVDELCSLGFSLRLVKDNGTTAGENFDRVSIADDKILATLRQHRDTIVSLRVIEYQNYSVTALLRKERGLKAEIRKHRQNINSILEN